MTPELTALLNSELTQIHEYVRHILAVYVTWFSFFLTLLLTAMGWTLKESLSAESRVTKPAPFYCMVFLFSIQLVLSIIATAFMIVDVRHASARVAEILTMLGGSAGSRSPIPDGIEVAFWLMGATLCINLIFWLWVARLVQRCKGKVLAFRAA